MGKQRRGEVWNEHHQLAGAFRGGAVYYCYERNACDLVLESAVRVAKFSKVRKLTWYIPDINPCAMGAQAMAIRSAEAGVPRGLCGDSERCTCTVRYTATTVHYTVIDGIRLARTPSVYLPADMDDGTARVSRRPFDG